MLERAKAASCKLQITPRKGQTQAISHALMMTGLAVVEKDISYISVLVGTCNSTYIRHLGPQFPASCFGSSADCKALRYHIWVLGGKWYAL